MVIGKKANHEETNRAHTAHHTPAHTAHHTPSLNTFYTFVDTLNIYSYQYVTVLFICDFSMTRSNVVFELLLASPIDLP